jgi:NADP-dependent 3-hydroxy acid dehydrogenase YdfG
MKDETVAPSALQGERRKVALVVGAGDATGSAIARRFAREGYVACLARRSADKLQPLVDQIRAAGGEAEGFATDAQGR